LAPEGIRFATREENSCMNFLVYWYIFQNI
jgi:hypothetical protein